MTHCTLPPSVLNTSVEIILLSYKSDCYPFTQTLTEASHLRIKACPYTCLQSPTQSHTPLLLWNRFLLARGLIASHTGLPLLPHTWQACFWLRLFLLLKKLPPDGHLTHSLISFRSGLKSQFLSEISKATVKLQYPYSPPNPLSSFIYLITLTTI